MTSLIRISDSRRNQLIGIAVIGIVWEVYGRTSSGFIIDPFSTTVIAFVDLYLSGSIYGPLFQSLQQFVIGFLLALAVALPIGLMMGFFEKLRYFLDIYVNTMFVTSTAALLPLLIIVFGTGLEFRVAVVFLAGVFHMIWTFQSGVENIDGDIIATGRAYSADGWKLYRYVILPASLPFIIAGTRLGLGRSFKGMVIAELWIYAGIGSLLRGYQQNQQLDYAMAIILTLMIIAVLTSRGMFWLENKFAPWRSVDIT